MYLSNNVHKHNLSNLNLNNSLVIVAPYKIPNKVCVEYRLDHTCCEWYQYYVVPIVDPENKIKVTSGGYKTLCKILGTIPHDQWCFTHFRTLLSCRAEAILPSPPTKLKMPKIFHKAWNACGKPKQIPSRLNTKYSEERHLIIVNSSIQ